MNAHFRPAIDGSKTLARRQRRTKLNEIPAEPENRPFCSGKAVQSDATDEVKRWVWQFAGVPEEVPLMNKFMVATIGLLLGATAMTVDAQGYSGRGRDEGRGQNSGQSQPAQAESSGKDRGGNSGYSGRGGGDHNSGGRQSGAPANSGRQDGRGDRGNQGGQNYGGRNGEGRGSPGLASSGAQSQWGGGYNQGGYNQGSQGRGDHDNRGDRSQYGRGDSRGYNNSGWNNDRRGDRHERGYGNGYNNGYSRNHNRGWNDWRRGWNHGWSGNRYRAPARYYYPRGYGHRSWSIGLFLPSVFYAQNYYVDYRSYGIAAPPYGCHWVRVESDLLLVEIGTGEIIDILYGFYY
jgi:Ni/Co efflux regulator RcnB